MIRTKWQSILANVKSAGWRMTNHWQNLMQSHTTCIFAENLHECKHNFDTHYSITSSQGLLEYPVAGLTMVAHCCRFPLPSPLECKHHTIPALWAVDYPAVDHTHAKIYNELNVLLNGAEWLFSPLGKKKSPAERSGCQHDNIEHK